MQRDVRKLLRFEMIKSEVKVNWVNRKRHWIVKIDNQKKRDNHVVFSISELHIPVLDS